MTDLHKPKSVKFTPPLVNKLEHNDNIKCMGGDISVETTTPCAFRLERHKCDDIAVFN